MTGKKGRWTKSAKSVASGTGAPPFKYRGCRAGQKKQSNLQIVQAERQRAAVRHRGATASTEVRPRYLSAQREKRRHLDQGEEVDENYIMQSAQPLPLENKLFEECYVAQGILTQDEVEKFMEYTKKPLPLSFRLTLGKSNVRELVRVLKKDFFPKLTELGPEGGVLQPPTNIPWISDETVWEMQFDETAVAENKIVKDFKTFLYQETQCGNIIQQDVASMLPACLLDVKPHHNVLDLRASPGHRAIHLVQLLHSDENIPNPDGIVIANETHLKRCFAMHEQIKQYFSPNFAIVNMDANNLPSLFLTAGKDPKPLVYDRIICGFPSSGDGMFRNNLDGLRCWTANMPLSHHGHLTQMLYSGMSSLEIGGRLVFFTYSMNPVEAEAVAYAVIMQQRGTVELVDVSKEMPNLIYEKGLHSWKVVAKGPRWFREYEEVPEHLQNMVWPSMFPPSKEEAERVGLDRCIRILPHKQNTVGLFIAVFTRTSSIFEAWQREQEEQQKAYEAAEEARRLEEAKLLEEKKKLKEEEERKKKEEKEKEKEKEKAKESEKSDEVEGVESAKEKDAEEDKSEKKTEKGEGKTAEAEDGKGEEKSEVVVKADAHKEGTVEADEVKEEESMVIEEESGGGQNAKNGVEDDYADGGNEAADVTVAEDEGGNYYANTYQEEDGGVKGGDAADDTRRSRIEGQFDFFDANDKLWLQLKDFYGLSDDFPYMRMACRPVSGLKQNFVLVTDTIKKVVENNQSLYSFVQIGVKVFTHMKQPDVACCYRLALEGLSTILPYMTKRIVTVSKRDFIAVLSSHNPTVDGFTIKTKKEVTNLEKGGFAFVLEPDRAKNSHKCQVVISAWKEEDTSYRTFIPAYQRLHYLRVAGANMNDYEEHPETHHDVECAMAAFSKSFPL